MYHCFPQKKSNRMYVNVNHYNNINEDPNATMWSAGNWHRNLWYATRKKWICAMIPIQDWITKTYWKERHHVDSVFQIGVTSTCRRRPGEGSAHYTTLAWWSFCMWGELAGLLFCSWRAANYTHNFFVCLEWGHLSHKGYSILHQKFVFQQ